MAISSRSAAAPGRVADGEDRALPPPQFSLAWWFAAVAAVGCLLGLMTLIGPVWSAMLMLGLVLAAAHVLGNAIGTRLRDGGSPPARATGSPPASPVAPVTLSPPGCLQNRTPLSHGIWPAAALGAAASGAAGGAVLQAYAPAAGAAGIGLGVLSTAVLGGYAGWLAGSFCIVWRAARREALDQEGPGHAADRTAGRRRAIAES